MFRKKSVEQNLDLYLFIREMWLEVWTKNLIFFQLSLVEEKKIINSEINLQDWFSRKDTLLFTKKVYTK